MLNRTRTMNFLRNFDPEKSARERRKLTRKSYFINKPHKNRSIYNEKGQITVNGKDLCDCLDETCPGCHFPCSKCSSNKCGHECRKIVPTHCWIHSSCHLISAPKCSMNNNLIKRHRVNRKWMYEKIEVEGNDFVVKNEYFQY